MIRDPAKFLIKEWKWFISDRQTLLKSWETHQAPDLKKNMVSRPDLLPFELPPVSKLPAPLQQFLSEYPPGLPKDLKVNCDGSSPWKTLVFAVSPFLAAETVAFTRSVLLHQLRKQRSPTGELKLQTFGFEASWRFHGRNLNLMVEMKFHSFFLFPSRFKGEALMVEFWEGEVWSSNSCYEPKSAAKDPTTHTNCSKN